MRSIQPFSIFIAIRFNFVAAKIQFKMKLLILDNKDSFTFNLRQLFEEAGCTEIQVCSTFDYQVADAEWFDKIVFSPGPGLPEEFPVMKHMLKQYGETKSILGICLGHQAIAGFFGASLLNLNQVVHGKQLQVTVLSEDPLFQGIRSPFEAGLYHSWSVEERDFPEQLEITAKSSNGGVMALRHKKFDIRGVQFHPESFMTPDGLKMIKNWLSFRSPAP